MASSSSSSHIRIVAGADEFGLSLKDALLSHLRTNTNISIDIVDLGTGPYYSVADEVGQHVSCSSSPNKNSNNNKNNDNTRGLLVCGTGIGVAVFANKHPRVYASNCTSVADAVNTRSINDCNVLCLGGTLTSPDEGARILDAWLATPFKSPCPASGGAPWPPNISSFLDSSLSQMANLPSSPCPLPTSSICCLREGMQFEEVEIMPGGEMRILRESPTSALVRFSKGCVEPAHHHTFGHDILVVKGRKRVWNLSKGESYEMKQGDFLFTPGGDLHRVKYFEDTEFFIRWDGKWDIFLDEDLQTARAALDKA